MNAIGGCCGTTPEHIAAIREMASAYPPRQLHDVPQLLRLSGLEPLNYQPNPDNMRETFLMIGERCNVAGSIIYKKAIVDGDYDKAVSIALSQVRGALCLSSRCVYQDWAALCSLLRCCTGWASAGVLQLGWWRLVCLHTPAAVWMLDVQVNAGAHVLDINMDDGLIDGVPAMTRFVNLLVSDPEASRVPFMVDSSKFFIIEAGLKCCQVCT